MADIDHHLNTKSSTAGSDWPVQLTHGHVISFRKGSWRLATGLEHHGALGFNMFGKTDKFPVSKMHRFISELTPQQQKLLSGNGMHLVPQSSWMVYVLENIVRIDSIRPSKFRRLGSWQAPDDEEDQGAGPGVDDPSHPASSSCASAGGSGAQAR